MSENESLLLNDKQVYPSDELIFSIIGDRKDLWIRILNYMKSNFTDSSGEWNYYNDGKRWLFKMVRKKKTVFWAGLLSDTFRVTFYLGNKAEDIMENSDLSQEIRDEFRNAKRYGLIRPVSFVIRNDTDVENVLKMIEIKNKLK